MSLESTWGRDWVSEAMQELQRIAKEQAKRIAELEKRIKALEEIVVLESELKPKVG